MRALCSSGLTFSFGSTLRSCGLRRDMSKIRVAVAQMRPGRSVAELTERIVGHIAEAGRVGAKLAVFPECATTGERGKSRCSVTRVFPK